MLHDVALNMFFFFFPMNAKVRYVASRRCADSSFRVARVNVVAGQQIVVVATTAFTQRLIVFRGFHCYSPCEAYKAKDEPRLMETESFVVLKIFLHNWNTWEQMTQSNKVLQSNIIEPFFCGGLKKVVCNKVVNDRNP